MEQKNNKGLVITMVILTIIALGLGCYITTKHFDIKITKQEVKTKDKASGDKNESNKEEITLYEVENALNRESYENKYYYLKRILSNNKNLKEITNEEKLYYSYSVLNPSNDSFSATDLEKAFQSTILGTLELEHGDIYYEGYDDTPTYIYNKDTKIYTYNNDLLGHGGYGGIEFIGLNYNFYNDKDYYVLEQYGVYNTYLAVGPNCSEYYGKYDEAVDKKNALFTNPYDYESDEYQYDTFNPKETIRDNFEKYRNNLTKVTYKFQKENGVLRLVDMQKE